MTDPTSRREEIAAREAFDRWFRTMKDERSFAGLLRNQTLLDQKPGFITGYQAAKADAILASDGEGVPSRPVCLPEGWVAVPREPTKEMVDTCYGPVNRDGDRFRKAGTFRPMQSYRAMVAAAPPLPEPTQTSASDGEREMVRELVTALEPFKFIADVDHGLADGESTMVNITRCRQAAAIHAKAKEWLEGNKSWRAVLEST